MPRSQLVLCVLVVGLAVLPPASRARAQSDESSVLERYDQNGDGRLQRSEVPIRMLDRFSRLDVDGDGALDEFELAADRATVPTPRPARASGASGGPAGSGGAQDAPRFELLLRTFDSNRDGLLERSEAPSSLFASFDSIDVNGDGRLDRDELARAQAKRDERRTGDPRSAAFAIRFFDTDADGLLQYREAPLRMQRHFGDFDTNHDGAIDPAEARAADARRAKAGDPGGGTGPAR